VKLPDTTRAAKQRRGIRAARVARAHILDNVQPPEFPRGWTSESEPDWDDYDHDVRRAATGVSPLSPTANYAYWRTLAILFRGEALDAEYRTHVIPAIKTRAERHRSRAARRIRRGL
jgi:hypothetical protein